MIYLSPQAISEIKRKQLSLRLENVWFRLAVKSGGCSGLFYDMCFEKAVKGGDVTFNCNGIQVIVDEQTLNYINGLKLDLNPKLKKLGKTNQRNRIKLELLSSV